MCLWMSGYSMKNAFNVNPAALFLLLVITLRASSSPLQDARSGKNYLHDDDEELARKNHHEVPRPKPIHTLTTPLTHGGHYGPNPNYLLHSGYDHHEHLPVHVVDDIHHRPSFPSYHEAPAYPTIFPERPSLVNSHLSSVLAPMVRNIVSNVLISLAHRVSSGIVTGLAAERPPPAYHGAYQSPYHYRPYLDGHKSGDGVSYPYDIDKLEIMDYFNEPSFLQPHPSPEQHSIKDSTLLKPSKKKRPIIMKGVTKKNRESSSDSSELLV
ncbi:uncharacterized protein LOC120353581 [Nilaparvata lugens]|uniref:uncharacterized protein LOC120353581 n=1 Tax=Nilaparvata lugens TaxID=108931 RepID=UPI00193E8238|nr:uncharacterized protein LOC120353581 [Nilaparvata lugens]